MTAGGGTCPFCGARGSVPGEDSWSCPSCGRSYPTLAYKCRYPDCWEFVYFKDYCEHHQNEAKNRDES